MKIIRKDAEPYHVNDENCKATEIDFEDKDINFCVAKINGRSPLSGYEVNGECNEYAYVLRGEGIITNQKGDKITFSPGDTVKIMRGEPYFWDGNCELFCPCSPAWTFEQHRTIK